MIRTIYSDSTRRSESSAFRAMCHYSHFAFFSAFEGDVDIGALERARNPPDLSDARAVPSRALKCLWRTLPLRERTSERRFSTTSAAGNTSPCQLRQQRTPPLAALGLVTSASAVTEA